MAHPTTIAPQTIDLDEQRPWQEGSISLNLGTSAAGAQQIVWFFLSAPQAPTVPLAFTHVPATKKATWPDLELDLSSLAGVIVTREGNYLKVSDVNPTQNLSFSVKVIQDLITEGQETFNLYYASQAASNNVMPPDTSFQKLAIVDVEDWAFNHGVDLNGSDTGGSFAYFDRGPFEHQENPITNTVHPATSISFWNSQVANLHADGTDLGIGALKLELTGVAADFSKYRWEGAGAAPATSPFGALDTPATYTIPGDGGRYVITTSFATATGTATAIVKFQTGSAENFTDASMTSLQATRFLNHDIRIGFSDLAEAKLDLDLRDEFDLVVKFSPPGLDTTLPGSFTVGTTDPTAAREALVSFINEQPEFSSAVYNGKFIELFFHTEDFDPSPLARIFDDYTSWSGNPDPALFTVMVTVGVGQAAVSYEVDVISAVTGSSVLLELDTEIGVGSDVLVSYTDLAGDQKFNVLQSWYGTDAKEFVDEAVIEAANTIVTSKVLSGATLGWSDQSEELYFGNTDWGPLDEITANAVVYSGSQDFWRGLFGQASGVNYVPPVTGASVFKFNPTGWVDNPNYDATASAGTLRSFEFVREAFFIEVSHAPALPATPSLAHLLNPVLPIKLHHWQVSAEVTNDATDNTPVAKFDLIHVQAPLGIPFHQIVSDFSVGMSLTAIGSNFADVLGLPTDSGTVRLNGGDGDDILYAGIGDAFLDGGAGDDTAVFVGPKSFYTIAYAVATPFTGLGDGFTIKVTGNGSSGFADGNVIYLKNIENLEFGEKYVTTDLVPQFNAVAPSDLVIPTGFHAGSEFTHDGIGYINVLRMPQFTNDGNFKSLFFDANLAESNLNLGGITPAAGSNPELVSTKVYDVSGYNNYVVDLPRSTGQSLLFSAADEESDFVVLTGWRETLTPSFSDVTNRIVTLGGGAGTDFISFQPTPGDSGAATAGIFINLGQSVPTAFNPGTDPDLKDFLEGKTAVFSQSNDHSSHSLESLPADPNGTTNAFVIVSGVEGVVGSVGTDTIIAGSSRLVASGGAGNDLLVGSMGADVLYGGLGRDSLRGGGGDDILVDFDGAIFQGDTTGATGNSRGNDVFVVGQPTTGTVSFEVKDFDFGLDGQSRGGDKFNDRLAFAVSMASLASLGFNTASLQQHGGGVLSDLSYKSLMEFLSFQVTRVTTDVTVSMSYNPTTSGGGSNAPHHLASVKLSGVGIAATDKIEVVSVGQDKGVLSQLVAEPIFWEATGALQSYAGSYSVEQEMAWAFDDKILIFVSLETLDASIVRPEFPPIFGKSEVLFSQADFAVDATKFAGAGARFQSANSNDTMLGTFRADKYEFNTPNFATNEAGDLHPSSRQVHGNDLIIEKGTLSQTSAVRDKIVFEGVTINDPFLLFERVEVGTEGDKSLNIKWGGTGQGSTLNKGELDVFRQYDHTLPMFRVEDLELTSGPGPGATTAVFDLGTTRIARDGTGIAQKNDDGTFMEEIHTSGNRDAILVGRKGEVEGDEDVFVIKKGTDAVRDLDIYLWDFDEDDTVLLEGFGTVTGLKIDGADAAFAADKTTGTAPDATDLTKSITFTGTSNGETSNWIVNLHAKGGSNGFDSDFLTFDRAALYA